MRCYFKITVCDTGTKLRVTKFLIPLFQLDWAKSKNFTLDTIISSSYYAL